MSKIQNKTRNIFGASIQLPSLRPNKSLFFKNLPEELKGEPVGTKIATTAADGKQCQIERTYTNKAIASRMSDGLYKWGSKRP
jgi:hypothetical protein